MAEVVSGSRQLAELAARLKVAGARDLRLQLLRGMKAAAKPLVPKVQDAARNQLPKRGGLNEHVGGQRVSVSVRTGARTAGVRLTTTAPDTQQTDSGIVRHPVFGNRKKWVVQKIPAATGWWSATLEREGPSTAPHLLEAMEVVAAQVQGRGI